MRKSEYLAYGIWIIAIVGIILVSGCSKQESSTELTTTQTSKELAKESIQDILAKAENVGPVNYEVVSINSMTGLPQEMITEVTMKVWQKIPYMKIESTTVGTTTKMIVHPDATYFYDAAKDKYSKKTAEEMTAMVSQKPFEEFSRDIRESTTLKELGTEIIDGKLTTIVEYSVDVEGTPVKQKLWIWNEKGIPLKVESSISMEEIVTTTNMEYKNFVFEDIPDSVFEVPEDKII